MLPRLPWEVVLWGMAPIPGLPTTTKVDEQYLVNNRGARLALFDLWPKDLQLTFQEVITQVRKTRADHHEGQLQGFRSGDRFLTQQAESMGAQIYRTQALERMPKQHGPDVKVEEVLEWFRKPTNESLFLALGVPQR